MKRFFLGLAANYSREERLAHTFSIGREEDCRDLKTYLTRKYGGERVVLTKNGRSALALALKAHFDKGDKILVNGFTCFAVYEAIKAAELEPVFVDINLKSLNFGEEELSVVCSTKNKAPAPKGIIIQNTLGNPVDIVEIEKFAKEHKLTIIEDLAHCAGVKYADGREAGTVGAATVMSFGKDKSIDTVSGGAVIFRESYKNLIEAPSKSPKISDHLRARFYPTFGVIARVLTKVHLSGIFVKTLLKIHWIEKSADNKLDLTRKISKFEARRALIKIKSLSRYGERPLRQFFFVKNRDEVLGKLQAAGYYFESFWYEKPVSPKRYYKKVHFNEESCPNAVWAAEHIINFPTYYRQIDLEPARKIIANFLEVKK